MSTSSAIATTSAGGRPVTNANVENGYTPGNNFNVTCDVLGLPSDCTARITPQQINVIASELLALADCFDPNGNWDCRSVTNLCTNFTSFIENTGPDTLWRYVQDILCARPEKEFNANAGDRFLICDGDGNVQKTVSLITAEQVAALICDSLPARQTLAACLISQTAPEQGLHVHVSGDELLATKSFTLRGQASLEALSNPIMMNGSAWATDDLAPIVIPNPYSSPIPVHLSLYLRGEANEIIQDGSFTLTLSLFDDAAYTGPASLYVEAGLNDTGNTGTITPKTFDPQVAATRIVVVPAGGLTLYPRIRHRALPPGNAWNWVMGTGDTVGVVSWYGTFAENFG